MPWFEALRSASLYGGAAVLLFLSSHIVIPRLIAVTGLEPVVVWFLAGGLLVFLPIAIAAVVILRLEGCPTGGPEFRERTWRGRLRFRPLTRREAFETLCALGLMIAASAASLAVARAFLGEVRLGPSFLQFQPLGRERLWILAAWVPFFVLNIMGEEILWHAVLLPRQEAAFGRPAWFVAGLAWLLFHIPFGRDILLILWPTTFLTPWIVQRTRNSWSGVILHAGINGPGFVAAAFGWV